MTERAVVIKIPELVWGAGAPNPLVVASEDRTLFAFDAPEHLLVNDEYRRVAEFVGCTSVRFGFPNDEVQGGHPLYGKGLAFYSAHEVLDSRWLTELRGIERHHPLAPDTPFPDARHFLLTFHDSTLEAVARGVRVLGAYASDAVAESVIMAELRAR